MSAARPGIPALSDVVRAATMPGTFHPTRQKMPRSRRGAKQESFP
jgi:hypothetical protein